MRMAAESTDSLISVIHRDEFLIAINKPAGLLVHPSPIDKRESRSALKLLRDRVGRWVYPVHRLDKPTSGVLLFALSPQTARTLGQRFLHQQVRKSYLAVVRGYTDSAGRIDHPLRDLPDEAAPAGAGTIPEPRDAVTEYRTLGTAELPYPVDRYPSARYSLLLLRPRTGRRHQIRRHLKHVAHRGGRHDTRQVRAQSAVSGQAREQPAAARRHRDGVPPPGGGAPLSHRGHAGW